MAQHTVAGASSSRVYYLNLNFNMREQDAPATFKRTMHVWDYFNPYNEIDIRSGGNLPHWEQGSVWYFVTFRLADALPQKVVEAMKAQREDWKKSHKLDSLNQDEIGEYHRLFTQRYEDLLNAGNGSCILREPANAAIVDDALRYFEKARYNLDEYVIMPNHVHVLVRPIERHCLKDILHSWKSFTANKINRRKKRSGQLWQHESYDHIVRHERAMQAIRLYILENPKVAEPLERA